MTLRPLYAALLGLGLAAPGSAADASAPDWSAVPGTPLLLFYPGASPFEWVTSGPGHGGVRALRRGDRCLDCHEDELRDMGQAIVSGQSNEPTPIPGKAAVIPLTMQAAHDGENLHLRFVWQQPPGGAEPQDAKNRVKLSLLFAGDGVERASQFGCWQACHGDSRSMPGGSDDRSKYLHDASLAEGRFFDLIQWTSSGAVHDGHIAEQREMAGGNALLAASGTLDGDTWTVTFTRRLAADGVGSIGMTPGQAYDFGIAIHDDHSSGRFHHVSLCYRLGIDAAGDVRAAALPSP
jgi:hypothetical protein